MTRKSNVPSPRLGWYTRRPLQMLPMLGRLKSLSRGIVEIYGDTLWLKNFDPHVEWQTIPIESSELAYLVDMELTEMERLLADRATKDALVGIEAYLHDEFDKGCELILTSGTRKGDSGDKEPEAPIEKANRVAHDPDDFDLSKWKNSGYLPTFIEIQKTWPRTTLDGQICELKKWAENKAGKQKIPREEKALLLDTLLQAIQAHPDLVRERSFLTFLKEALVERSANVSTDEIQYRVMDMNEPKDDYYQKVAKVTFDDEDIETEEVV